MPEIITEVIRQLKHWHKYPEQQPLEPPAKTKWELRRCITHQNRIGWKNFLKGHISLLWSCTQQQFFETHRSLKSGNSWAQKIIKALWTCIWHQWDCRNFGRHHTITPALKEEIIQIDAKIREQYELGFADLLSTDQMLISDPIEDILDHDIDYKQCWLASLLTARAKFHHQQGEHYKSLSASHANFNSWLNNST